MLMRAATVVQQLCKSCGTCFMFYCMFYFTCDRSLTVWTESSSESVETSRDRQTDLVAVIRRLLNWGLRRRWWWWRLGQCLCNFLPGTTAKVSSAGRQTLLTDGPNSRWWGHTSSLLSSILLHDRWLLTIVRENVWSKAKNVKSHVFGFSKRT